jgi:hypothetical protein
VAILRRALEINRNFPPTHFWLAAALAHVGRQNEAFAATQAGLALSPTFTISLARPSAAGSNPIHLSQRERLFDGMRKAGVPEE